MGRPDFERSQFSGRGRGGFAQRGGRGAFRGGFQSSQNSRSATGENKLQPQTGMRQWGSAPASEVDASSTAPGTPVATSGASGADEEPPKKKKRKGDKGGTGVKANSRVSAEEDPSKKRKREDGETREDVKSVAPTEKSVKRIKKHMKKLEDKVSGSITLADWLKRVAEGKEKTVDQSDVLHGVQVSFVDGHWQMSI